MGKKRTPYHKPAWIDFGQVFYPVNKREHYFDTILRFRIFNYYPAGKEFIENANYYLLDSDLGEKAIIGIAWNTEGYRSKVVHPRSRMFVSSGDPELFGYVHKILLARLYELKEQEFIENGYDLQLNKTGTMV